MYEHETIKIAKDTQDHYESMKYASDAISEAFLQFRKFSFHGDINNSLQREQLCKEIYLRDTDDYPGATYGDPLKVSNVYDCLKHCYTDSKCQAYQIDVIDSDDNEMNCLLFSEVVELPSVSLCLESQRTIGIKPNRFSSSISS